MGSLRTGQMMARGPAGPAGCGKVWPAPCPRELGNDSAKQPYIVGQFLQGVPTI